MFGAGSLGAARFLSICGIGEKMELIGEINKKLAK
jgi:hypothetical protein